MLGPVSIYTCTLSSVVKSASLSVLTFFFLHDFRVSIANLSFYTLGPGGQLKLHFISYIKSY